MTSSKINQQNYNIWSKSYDHYPNPTVAIDELTLPGLYKDWSKKKVLEIGCGTGRHTVRLAKQQNEITAIDVSDGMLNQAREKLPAIDFIHGDFMEYVFQENSFEKVLMSLVLEHISDLDQFFKKIDALLLPGGEILISELHPKRGAQGSLAHFKIDSGDEIFLASKAHGEGEVRSSAEKSGLQLNFKKDFHGNEKLVSLDKKWKKYSGQPMIQVWSFLK